MTYYPDLSPYEYFRDEEYEILGTLNVGWLDKAHIYPQAEPSEEFLDRLFDFCMSSVQLTRGFHECEFCEPLRTDMVREWRGEREVWLGSGEIRVIYRGRVYAAPNLIYHYVAEHKYRPPDKFVEAVLQGPRPDSAEYQALKEKFWG